MSQHIGSLGHRLHQLGMLAGTTMATARCSHSPMSDAFDGVRDCTRCGQAWRHSCVQEPSQHGHVHLPLCLACQQAPADEEYARALVAQLRLLSLVDGECAISGRRP